MSANVFSGTAIPRRRLQRGLLALVARPMAEKDRETALAWPLQTWAQ